MVKLSLKEVNKLTAKLSTTQNLIAKLSSGGTESGTTIQSVLDSITVSNGIVDKRDVNKLDISGENLETDSLSNFDIKEILDL